MNITCTEIFSHVADKPFVVFFLSDTTTPATYTLNNDDKQQKTFKALLTSDSLALVGQMYFKRQNDDGKTISQYLGSSVVDLSTISDQEYTFSMHDSSSHPPLKTGQITMKIQLPVGLVTNHLKIQNPTFSREMYTAADANLTYIEGFGSKGLSSVVEGLKYVHSPYYVNHVGVTIPSGAFCMIPTVLEDDLTQAVKSHKQRLLVALSRNCMRSKDWSNGILDMLGSTIKSKHLRCLSVVADALTLHARLEINYTPDVQITPESKGTERWSVPREPAENGGLSFTGDCEDFAREVYQQCKEIREWIKPEKTTIMGQLSMVLHMYVPTIEQGAVDSSAHSKYITYDAPYRNHIWSALHPRNAWTTKMIGKASLQHLYDQFPKQHCENTLPLLHLEGTGDVYPVVTKRKPGYICKMNQKSQQIVSSYPFVRGMSTPDMALQCDHKSNFYKYAIAFMTDIFQDQGLLDYTYVTDRKYGVNIYDWSRGQYHFIPSTRHSTETMNNIKEMIRIERPISAITTVSTINKKPTLTSGYFLRYGQSEPIETDYENTAEYQVGSHSWYEAYFKIDDSETGSEIEVKN